MEHPKNDFRDYSNNSLMHYGVLGMKWGHRKVNPIQAIRDRRQRLKEIQKMKAEWEAEKRRTKTIPFGKHGVSYDSGKAEASKLANMFNMDKSHDKRARLMISKDEHAAKVFKNWISDNPDSAAYKKTKGILKPEYLVLNSGHADEKSLSLAYEFADDDINAEMGYHVFTTEYDPIHKKSHYISFEG